MISVITAPQIRGAVGIKREDDLTKEVGNRVIARLTALGHKCVKTQPGRVRSVWDSLRQRCRLANAQDVDVVVSIHFNASASHKGKGSEVYYISDAGKAIANSVQNELIKLGFINREIKYGAWYLLKNTKAPAILVEVAFCDNADDMDLVDRVGYDSIANAIVLGLVAT